MANLAQRRPTTYVPGGFVEQQGRHAGRRWYLAFGYRDGGWTYEQLSEALMSFRAAKDAVERDRAALARSEGQ